ncbi:MAG TPA: DNA primase [Thermoanaerobaculia bacterium]|nr:DNA primase [Thermoanaerobaculia bacterium]
MPIPQATLQEIRQRTDLAALAAEHTSLKRRGSRLYGICPFHQESTPSFSVDPERRLFFCFGCRAGGDAIRFVMLASHLSFPEAAEVLARRAGIPLWESRAAGRGPGDDVAAALAAAAELFVQELGRHPPAVRYLDGRQVPPAVAARFGLGYAPGAWTALHDALAPRFGPELLAEAGLLLRSQRRAGFYDRFRDRIMFPLYEAGGRLAGFAGRSLGSGEPVYLNSPESPLFHKREILFGYPQGREAVRSRRRVIVAEGYFDVLAFAACGAGEAVSAMGTHLAPGQVRLLAREAGEVVLAFDSDAAGREALRRALPALLPAGLAVRALALPDGHDPASLREQRGDTALVASLAAAEDALGSELSRLAASVRGGDTLAHAQAITASLKLLALLPETPLRISYARLAGRLLDVPADALLAALTRTPRASRPG